MITREFLERVLPDIGLICIAELHSSGRGFKHHFFDSAELAISKALALDGSEKTVYFGCATYRTPDNREQSNVHAVKSFWIDVDVGDGKPYSDLSEAGRALQDMLAKTRLPEPLLVKSGRGLHCYWPLEAATDPQTWRVEADKLKAVLHHVGFEIDRARTSDHASVLRLPGTHHRKGSPKLVKVIYDGSVTSLDDFRAILDSYIDLHDVTVPRRRGEDDSLNADLTGGVEYTPGNADKIANQCAVMQHIRDTRGNVPEPIWYGGLGVLAYCADGDEIAQAWSSGHPKYDREATARKLTQWKSRVGKPATCSLFHGHQPDKCATCPFWGKINSPIALSFRTELLPATAEIDENAPRPPTSVPWPFQLQADGVYANLDKVLKKAAANDRADDTDGHDKKLDPIRVACPRFYPVGRLNQGIDGYGMEVEMEVRRGQYRKFTLPASLIGRGGPELMATLCKNEIVAEPGMQAFVTSYLQRWINHQREKAEEIKVYDHFGWHGRDFLLGDKLYTAKKTRPAVLKGAVAEKAKHMAPVGNYADWQQAIDRLYNHPGLQAHQFMIMCSFAALLIPMLSEVGGITVFARSGSGFGKTTAIKSGFSAYGHPDRMLITQNNVTRNALVAWLGIYHNLPVSLDELTNMTPEAASDLAYMMAEGVAKARSGPTGAPLNTGIPWQTILISTGNNSLQEKLMSHRANADGELYRVFEFALDQKGVIDPIEAAKLVRTIRHSYGHAGILYVRYLVENYDRVQERILERRDDIASTLRCEAQDRYWSALYAAVITALDICRTLDIVRFPVNPLFQWMADQLVATRMETKSTQSTPREIMRRAISEHAAGIIVTEGLGDVRRHAPSRIIQDPRGSSIVGRYVLERPHSKSRLMISSQAMRSWCAKSGISSKDLFASGVKGGWLQKKIETFRLGHGTDRYAYIQPGAVWVVLDPDMASQGIVNVADNSEAYSEHSDEVLSQGEVAAENSEGRQEACEKVA